MDSLRLILLIMGIFVIVGVYLKFRSADEPLIHWLKNLFLPVYTEVQSPIKPSQPLDDEIIPVLSPLDDEPEKKDFDELSEIISTRNRLEEYSRQENIHFNAREEKTESGTESLLIILYILSPRGHVFAGDGLHSVMLATGLNLGEHDIYHYEQNKQSLFCVANAIEPGYFKLNELKNISTPGIALFMQFPAPLECRKALDILLDVSQRLAEALKGDLCDENRCALTQQTISHLKERVDEYRRRQLATRNQ